MNVSTKPRILPKPALVLARYDSLGGGLIQYIDYIVQYIDYIANVRTSVDCAGKQGMQKGNSREDAYYIDA